MSKDFLFINECKNQKLEEKVLDLKKENLLLLQQNIEKDNRIKELENEINIKHLQYKENIIKTVSEIRNSLVERIDNKIKSLKEKDLNTTNILYELRREI